MLKKELNSIFDVLDRSTLASIVMISVLASLLTLSIPVAAQTLINLIAFGKLLQPVLTLSIIVLILMLALGALNIWQVIIVEVIQQKLMVKISLNLTRQFTRLSLDNFSAHHGPELVNRFFEVVTIKKALASLLLYGISLSLQLFFGLMLLMLYHPLFLVFDAFIFISIALIILIPYRKGLKSAKDECTQKHQIGAWLEELISSRFLFRFNDYHQYALYQVDRRLVAFLKARNTHFRQLIKHQTGFYILSAMASSLLLGLGGYLVINNQLSLGQLVAAELVLGALIYGFKRFGVLLENYYDLVSSEDKLDTVLNLPQEFIQSDMNQLIYPVKTIRIQHLTGAEVVVSAENPLVIYSEDSDQCHTFCEFLLGFKKDADFSVFINDMLCTEVYRRVLREKAILLSEPEWFAGSIYDNLLLNHRGIATDKLMDWLNYFGLAEKILRQPDGLKTIVYDWQTVFSELELYELMVIRTLLVEPELIVIDRVLDKFRKEDAQRILDALSPLHRSVKILLTQRKSLRPFDNLLELP